MTALKQRYLKAMGVDVWVRKGLAAAPAMSGPEDSVPVESDPESSALRLGIIVYDELGVVFTMPPEERVTACHRLCNDIARAMTGRESAGRAGELTYDSPNDVPPEESLDRKLAALPSRVIAFGDVAREYIRAGAPNEVVQRHDKMVLGAPDISEILDRPVIKRDIWHGLLKLQGT